MPATTGAAGDFAAERAGEQGAGGALGGAGGVHWTQARGAGAEAGGTGGKEAGGAGWGGRRREYAGGEGKLTVGSGVSTGTRSWGAGLA